MWHISIGAGYHWLE